MTGEIHTVASKVTLASLSSSPGTVNDCFAAVKRPLTSNAGDWPAASSSASGLPPSGSSILPPPPVGLAALNPAAACWRTFVFTKAAAFFAGSVSPTSTALPVSHIRPVTWTSSPSIVAEAVLKTTAASGSSTGSANAWGAVFTGAGGSVSWRSRRAVWALPIVRCSASTRCTGGSGAARGRATAGSSCVERSEGAPYRRPTADPIGPSSPLPAATASARRAGVPCCACRATVTLALRWPIAEERLRARGRSRGRRPSARPAAGSASCARDDRPGRRARAPALAGNAAVGRMLARTPAPPAEREAGPLPTGDRPAGQGRSHARLLGRGGRERRTGPSGPSTARRRAAAWCTAGGGSTARTARSARA